ncbi:MAG: phosphoribosyltransferase family protein [bacterium]
MAENAYLADPRIAEVLVSEADLARRVRALAREIVAAQPANGRGLYVLGVLNGAFMFFADLARELRRAGLTDASYGFVKTAAYGQQLKAAAPPQVRLDYEPADLRGQRLLLVEDLLDQGATLAFLRRELLDRIGAAEVQICVLLRKQLRDASPAVVALRAAVALDFVGFDLPDRWVAGYGLDAAGQFRDLPCVVAVREEYFQAKAENRES